MTALLAMIVGILAVGYAIWPLVRGRAVPPPTEGPDHGHKGAEAETAALLAWSAAAGELAPSEASGGAALDPEEVPK